MKGFITAFEKQVRDVFSQVCSEMCRGVDMDLAVERVKKTNWGPYVWDEVEKRLGELQQKIGG